ncbi:MAG: hypothetical protein NWE96_02595 [Candidatus Bathyarchaeota archaeon]|nr:hypothetical protein [Candidatus Bathyarchaeota archaeon]
MTSQAKNFNTKIIAAIIITIIVISSAVVAAQYLLSKPSSELPDMTLTLIGSNGQQKTLNKQDILALESYTSKGALKTSGGLITDVGTYTGVPISTLLDLVGGITSDQKLKALASDGYPMTYTYNQVINGQDFRTYDPTTRDMVNATAPVKLVLVYSVDGAPLSDDKGPLRIAILGSEGLATEGNLWSKKVIQLEVTSNQAPSPTPTATAKPTTAATVKPTATPSPTANPTATSWNIAVTGSSTITLTKGTFDTLVIQNFVSYTESGTTWQGTSLYQLALWAQNNGAISSSALTSGYVVKVVGAQGQVATFNSSRITSNQNIMLANTANNLALSGGNAPLTLTGAELSSAEKINGVAQIQILPIPDLTLTVVGADGNRVVLFSNDIAKMTSITYDGGSRKSTGTIVNVGNYTGIKLIDLCNLVGITGSNNVTVKAQDGYTTTYTYDKVANGVGFNTYDATGNPATPAHPLYLIVAYWYNGTTLGSDGPLKTMIVGVDGLLTDGSAAAKQIVEIDIIAA